MSLQVPTAGTAPRLPAPRELVASHFLPAASPPPPPHPSAPSPPLSVPSPMQWPQGGHPPAPRGRENVSERTVPFPSTLWSLQDSPKTVPVSPKGLGTPESEIQLLVHRTGLASEPLHRPSHPIRHLKLIQDTKVCLCWGAASSSESGPRWFSLDETPHQKASQRYLRPPVASPECPLPSPLPDRLSCPQHGPPGFCPF